MEITIILVNWNQAATTIRCVDSLFRNTRNETGFSFEVIIVDNNSEKDSRQQLEAFVRNTPHRPAIHLIRNAVNAGFAGGNNAGIRAALENGRPDYVWLLNNDIIVQEEALNKLVAAAGQYPGPKVWGSTIYEMTPRLHLHCAGGFTYNALLSIPTPITFSGELPLGLFHPLPEMDYPAGASMFVKAEIFRRTGLMDESYFLYYEELDLVRQIGGRQHLAWCPDSILHHEAGQSTGSKNPNKGEGSWIAHYYGNLSALKYTCRYHPLYLPVVFCFRLAVKSLLFVRYRDWDAFPPLLKAYRDFFRWLLRRDQKSR